MTRKGAIATTWGSVLRCRGRAKPGQQEHERGGDDAAGGHPAATAGGVVAPSR